MFILKEKNGYELGDSKMAIDQLQKEYLAQELEASVKMVRSGINEFHKVAEEKEFFPFSFFLIYNGFRKLMEVMLCFESVHKENRLPSADRLRKISHDLSQLNYEVALQITQ